MKLFLSVAFALCSFVAMSASLTWGCVIGTVTTPGGTPSTGDLVYLFQGDSSTNVASLLASGDKAAAIAGAVSSTTTQMGGFISNNDDLGNSFTSNTHYDWFVVVINEASNSFLVSAIESGLTMPEGTDIPDGTVGAYWDSDSFAGATWQQIGAIPEPTVLAMLALGVAGLALRRKVA